MKNREKGLPHNEQKVRVATRIATQGKRKKKKRKPLRERRQPRKRVVHGEENKKEGAKCCHL